MDPVEKLQWLRSNAGPAQSCGLPEETIRYFLGQSPDLQEAIELACSNREQLPEDLQPLCKLEEADLINKLSEGFLNFYPAETVSPYVPLAARGPWIVTLSGGVIYDVGGYGMIGFGHNPKEIEDSLSRPYVMANIMTPSFSQRRFIDTLRKKIGFTRSDQSCPFSRFICMNSGSEAMAVATRISDARAKKMTDPGQPYHDHEIRILSLSGSFHGRTTRPARISDSTRKKYQALASYRDVPESLIVEPNNVAQLEDVIDKLKQQRIYIEAIALEPVMGEGNPGLAITREFYDAVRRIARESDSFLLIDSIQAGLRAQGVLSIVDYPDFKDCDPPDMEAFSKAVNAGQFPLSVLALSEEAANSYAIGTYGNTMTANPRALEVGTAVMEMFDHRVSENIREQGINFLSKLNRLKQELPTGVITKVQGTGLLVSVELRSDILVVGHDGVEQKMRQRGINVIHGGANSLRYTPHFRISSDELDLLCQITLESIQGQLDEMAG